MKMREMATAFISYRDHWLMMKKESGRVFPFEFWSGVGGHLEPDEINRPYEACLREIEEETGLQPQDLVGLKLRYILLRQKDDEIRQQYVYFGESRHRDVVASEEGELYWIHQDEVLDLHLSTIVKLMIQHYREKSETERIYVGAMTLENGQPTVRWSDLADPHVF